MPEPRDPFPNRPLLRPDRRSLLASGLGLGLVLATHARAKPANHGEHPELAAVLDSQARPVTLYEGGLWCEGPVWMPAQASLVFSDVRANRMLRLPSAGGAEIFRAPSANANGNTLDRAGRLVTCEHRNRRVVRQEPDGRLTVLADSFEGRRLNSPNDVVVSGDGAVWFTDPTYGIDFAQEGEVSPSEQPGRFVYRLDPSGRLAVVADGFEQPNGLVFSPDERILYVSESARSVNPKGASEIRAFDVGDGRLSKERIFAKIEQGVPDGLAVDEAGRLYAGAGGGARIWLRDGTPLGQIAVPGPCANLAFGGADGRRLYLCAGARVLGIDLKVRGAGFRD